MKNLFEKPYIDVVKFSVLDVLTASATEDGVTFGDGATTDDTELTF